MRILLLSNLFPPESLGGYEILCEQVADGLHRMGHQVHVLTSNPGTVGQHPFTVERNLDLFLRFGRKPRRVRARRWFAARRNYLAAARTIAAFRPDIIFIWSQLRLTTGAALAAEHSKVPVAYTMNDEHLAGYTSPGAGLKAALRRLLDQRLLHIGIRGLKLEYTTSISETVKRRLVEQGVPIERSRVIFQGIPVDRFPCKAEPGALGASLRVLYVGQLHRYKGVHTAVEAVAKLQAEGRRVALTVCGAGDAEYEAELRALAASSGAAVEFRGRVPHAELAQIYREHSLFVFPSMWAEPFGLTHLEAMASGTPVVSTAEGGHGEFLREGENALLFKPGDADQLARRLTELADAPEQARALALRARAQVEREFTLDAYVDRLDRWLEEVWHASRHRSPWYSAQANAELMSMGGHR